MESVHDATYFPNIHMMLQNVQKEFATGKYNNMTECLNQYIRKNRYWPMLQTKSFFGKNGLVLLHNTYKRNDVDHFKDLYEEARSVVLDLNNPVGDNIVVSLANKIPDRLSIDEYKMVKTDTDMCEMGYEGTMVYVYYHRDRWFFGTSTCPYVDGSRFFHPTKTHGQMLDEVLYEMFPDVLQDEDETDRDFSRRIRNHFCETLNKNYTYGFMLVHHDNRNVMDYTSEFGQKYKVLIHLNTREKQNNKPVEDSIMLPYIFTSKKVSIEEGLALLENENNYCMIVHHGENMYKVSKNDIIQKEKENPGNSNPWMNMLSVYMQNDPSYRVDDYINKYLPNKKRELSVVSSSTGRVMSPTFIIHTVMTTMRDVLYNCYYSTTYYDKATRKYSMNEAIDKQLAPILRFHLAQLRYIQITSHAYGPITPKAVYHYLCLHQTQKNIRLLIQYFMNNAMNIPYVAVECFEILGSELFV